MFILIDVISVIGYLQFSLVQVYNFYRGDDISCGDNNILLMLCSRIIDFCYYFGPFSQSAFLVLCVHFISQMGDEMEGDSGSYEYDD